MKIHMKHFNTFLFYLIHKIWPTYAVLTLEHLKIYTCTSSNSIANKLNLWLFYNLWFASISTLIWILDCIFKKKFDTIFPSQHLSLHYNHCCSYYIYRRLGLLSGILLQSFILLIQGLQHFIHLWVLINQINCNTYMYM